MAKKYFKIVEKINNDIFSNVAAGLENDNVFESVTEEGIDAVDGINEEVETQLDPDDDYAVFKEDELEDDPSYEEPNEWEIASKEHEEESKKNPEDCINLMEIVSCYTNNYRKNFVNLADDKILEGTGTFKNHAMYDELEKVVETLVGMYNNTGNTYFDNLLQIRDLLHQEKKMFSICGTKKAPFIYEGIQLAYITQLHLIFMTTPYNLKLKVQFEEAMTTMGFDKDIKFFDKVLSDIIDATPVLGTKIKFQDSVKSEITGKDETISNTVYAESDLISEGHDTIVSDFEYAVESIQNLIEIKANKALLEYNVLIRDFSLVTSYLVSLEPKDKWETIRKSTYNLLLEEDTNKIDEVLVKTCSDLDEVLTSMVKAYKAIIKESSEN